MKTIGLDIGSSATKAVLLDGENITATYIHPSIPDMAEAAEIVISKVSPTKAPILTTGYGRFLYPGRIGEVTEITALVSGISFIFPDVCFVIDLGGQDSKVARIEGGKLQTFAMNDRCAAGTGRFIEVMCRLLGIEIDKIDQIITDDTPYVEITSTCTVFAETEVVGLLSKKTPRNQILKGILNSIARRISSLAMQIGVKPPVALSGGPMRSLRLCSAVSDALGYPVLVPPDPQIVTAIGAALICQRRIASNHF